MSEPMTVERAREIVAGHKAGNESICFCGPHDASRICLDAALTLSSENEKLAGMVKEKDESYRLCAIALESANDAVASLRADLKRTAGTLRREYEHCAEGAAEVDVLEAALTHHREAAKGLVELLENIAKGPEARIPVAAWTSAVRLAIREHLSNFAALTLSEAKTAPQAPEEGK